MSRQTGLVKLKGKMDGVVFYKMNGVDLARMASGPSKEKLMNSPAYRRTRENMNEFGGSATVGKALRLAIRKARFSKADANLAWRLQKLFKQMCLNGTGARGERSFEPVANAELLQQFEFNMKTSFSSVFRAPYSIHTTAARNEATFAALSFLPPAFIDAPPGATHFRVFSVLCTLSNYVYDPVTKRYMASDPTLDMLGMEVNSGMIAFNAVAPVSISLHAALPGSPTMTATVASVLLVGCEFFQRIGVFDYLLSEVDCMRVVKVF